MGSTRLQKLVKTIFKGTYEFAIGDIPSETLTRQGVAGLLIAGSLSASIFYWARAVKAAGSEVIGASHQLHDDMFIIRGDISSLRHDIGKYRSELPGPNGLAEERWCDLINRNMKKTMTGADQSAQQHPQTEPDREALKRAQKIQSPPDPLKEI